MHEYAVVGLHGVDEHLGEAGPPVGEERLVVGGFELHVALHAVGKDEVERPQKSVQKRRDEEMLLGEAKVVGRERVGLQILVGLSVIGQQGWQPFPVIGETGKATLVFAGYFQIAMQFARDVFFLPQAHFLCEQPGFLPKRGLRRQGRGGRCPCLHDFGRG